MAKNARRGWRIGSVRRRSQVQNPQTGLWTKRDADTGRFTGVKETLGRFKGIRREKRD